MTSLTSTEFNEVFQTCKTLAARDALSRARRQHILAALQAGTPAKEIAYQLGVTVCRIYALVRIAKQKGETR